MLKLIKIGLFYTFDRINRPMNFGNRFGIQMYKTIEPMQTILDAYIILLPKVIVRVVYVLN